MVLSAEKGLAWSTGLGEKAFGKVHDITLVGSGGVTKNKEIALVLGQGGGTPTLRSALLGGLHAADADDQKVIVFSLSVGSRLALYRRLDGHWDLPGGRGRGAAALALRQTG